MIADKSLHRVLRDSAEENFNFVWFDFISDIQILVDFLIGLNFAYKLKIHRATLYIHGKEVEATKLCKKLIKRKNSILVVDFQQDFEIDFSA